MNYLCCITLIMEEKSFSKQNFRATKWLRKMELQCVWRKNHMYEVTLGKSAPQKNWFSCSEMQI